MLQGDVGLDRSLVERSAFDPKHPLQKGGPSFILRSAPSPVEPEALVQLMGFRIGSGDGGGASRTKFLDR